MFKVVNNGKLPTRGSKYSACVDLYANEDATIGGGETAIVGLGVAIDFSINSLDYNFDYYTKREQQKKKDNFLKSHYILLEPRSSLRAKGLQVGSGIIDLDYPDELKLIVHNHTGRDFEIRKGDRIAQATLLEHKSYLFGIESKDERVGGIGSTDSQTSSDWSTDV